MKHVLCLNTNIMVSVMVSSSTLEIMWLPWAAWPSVQIKRNRHACVCVCVCVCVVRHPFSLVCSLLQHIIMLSHHTHTQENKPTFRSWQGEWKCKLMYWSNFCSEGCGVYVCVWVQANVCTCAILFHKINMSVKMMWISSSWAHWPVYVQ